MIAKVNWFILIFLQSMMMLLFITLMTMELISTLYAGMLCILVTTTFAIYVLNYNKIFTPLLPAIIFEYSFSLFIMQLVNTYNTLPYIAMVFIIINMAIWKIMTIISRGFNYDEIYQIEVESCSDKSLKKFISIMFLVGFSSTIFEWGMAGGVPFFCQDSEYFRFTVFFNGVTHILSIMCKMVVVIIGCYFIINGEIKKTIKKNKILFFEAIIAETLMIFTSMRGEMIMAPCVLFIIYAIRKRISLRFYFLFCVLLLAVIGILPFVRKMGIYGDNYISWMAGISKYPELFFLTPLYESFATNFHILSFDIDIFPNLLPFGLGGYSILPNIPFFDFGLSLGGVQNDVLNNNFYAGLTATYLSSWYADFGYAGFFIITILLAAITNYSYNLYIKTQSIFSLTWYAYTFYCALWIFYADVFDIVYVLYSLLLLCVYKFKL